MNSKIFSLLFLLALFMTACNDDKIIFFENHVKEEDNGGSETTVPRLFEVINLDYPGLEKVKAYYDKKDYVSATSELLEYYRNREDVTNPNINLGQTSIGDFFPKQIGTKSVNGRDFRQKQALHLPLQMPVFRLPGNFLLTRKSSIRSF